MRVFVLCIVFLCGFFSQSHAQQDSGAVFCRLIEKYAAPEKTPVGADYVPGIDVRGRAVAPADLGQGGEQGAVLQNFESVQIPITIDLAEKFGLTPPVGAEIKSDVALVGIHRDGRVMYNGQDIGAKARNICKENSHEPESNPEAK